MITWFPDMEVFRNLPLSVISVIFLYFLMFSIFLFWTYRTNQEHQKQEQEKDEKYKAELLKSAKKAEAANEAKTEFLQRMSHDIRTPINGICGMINVADQYADNMEKQTECRAVICLFDNSVKTKRRERSRGTFYYQRPGLFQAALDIVGVILDYGRVIFLFEQRGGDQEVGR